MQLQALLPMSGASLRPPTTRRFRLTERQTLANKLLAGRQKHTLLRGGSRSGKTFVLVRAIVLRALRGAGRVPARPSYGPISVSVLYPSIAPVRSNPSSETRGPLKPSRARPPGLIPSRGIDRRPFRAGGIMVASRAAMRGREWAMQAQRASSKRAGRARTDNAKTCAESQPLSVSSRCSQKVTGYGERQFDAHPAD
jgi:hypothetical protein